MGQHVPVFAEVGVESLEKAFSVYKQHLLTTFFRKQVPDINPAPETHITSLTLRRGYYNHVLRQVTFLFNKVILCIPKHAVMFVQVYANPFIGKRIMNI